MRPVVVLSYVFDRRFFAILPALNINMHSRTLEFEWLFFGVYLDFGYSVDAEPW